MTLLVDCSLKCSSSLLVDQDSPLVEKAVVFFGENNPRAVEIVGNLSQTHMKRLLSSLGGNLSAFFSLCMQSNVNPKEFDSWDIEKRRRIFKLAERFKLGECEEVENGIKWCTNQLIEAAERAVKNPEGEGSLRYNCNRLISLLEKSKRFGQLDERRLGRAYEWKGDEYLSRTDAGESLEKAVKMYELAAEYGIPSGVEKLKKYGEGLADQYLAGFNRLRNWDRALELYEKLRDYGVSGVDSKMGSIFEARGNNAKDLTTSLEMYYRAVDCGALHCVEKFIRTVESLADHYAHHSKDWEGAVNLYEDLVEAGVVRVQEKLRECRENLADELVKNEGGIEHLEKAMEGYLKCLEGGGSSPERFRVRVKLKNISRRVGEMYKEGRGIELNLLEAGKWFKIFEECSLELSKENARERLALQGKIGKEGDLSASESLDEECL